MAPDDRVQMYHSGMWLLCLMRAVLFRCATQHSGLKATVLCYTKRTPALLCMRASAVSNANTGVTCVRGQPCIQGCITGKEWRKTRPMFIFNTMCQQGKKKIILLPSAASLKRVNRSNSRGCKHLWGRLLPNLETLCNLYNLVSWALSSPWTSPPGHLSYLWAPTGSSSAKVSPPQCKSLPPQTLCRAQHCGWWSSGSHREVWCPAGPLHWRWWPSGDRRTRRHRLINQCSCVHKPTLPSAESGCRNENYPAGLKEEFIDFSGHVKIHKVRHFICLPCLNCS